MIDFVQVSALQAVFVDNGKQKCGTAVSIDAASLVMEGPSTAQEAGRKLKQKAKVAFEASVRAITKQPTFAVKGLPDEYVPLEDVFDLTAGRAISLCVSRILAHGAPGQVPTQGLHLKNTTACIYLRTPGKTTKQNTARGPSVGAFTEQVRAFDVLLKLHRSRCLLCSTPASRSLNTMQ